LSVTSAEIGTRAEFNKVAMMFYQEAAWPLLFDRFRSQ